MKVAICNVQEFNPIIGGIERVSVSIGTKLIEWGIEVVYIASLRSPYSDEYTLCAPQYFLPEPVDYSQKNVLAFTNIVLKEKVDIILNQNSHSYLYNKLCYEVKNNVGIPLVSVFHFCPDMRIRSKQNMIDFRFFTFKENIVNMAYDLATRWPFTLISMRDQRVLFSNMYKVSDKVVLLSDRFYKDFIRIGGLKNTNKLASINNLLSFPYFKGVDFTIKKKQILFVGRFNPQKNPYRPLYIWEKLQHRLPDWKLIMVGDGPWHSRVVELSRIMKLPNIEFKSFIDPIEYYKTSSIFCMTSNYEGWSLVLTEAMQYGCIPVAFESYDSIKDIIQEGKNGELVSPFNIDEFADKIYRLIHSGDMNNMALAANSSMSKFCPEVIMKQWLSLFNSLLA